jgi:hypothetical protein
MEQKQYTAKQWSEIEGGHTMSETPKKQYAFIGDMLESKMFRSKGKVEGSNARDMGDFAMMNMLALYVLYNEYDYAVVARDYAKRTMQYQNFKNFRAGGTDLNISLTAVRNGMADSGEKNELQSSKFNFNDMKIKTFLNMIAQGKSPTSVSSFFMRLERDLDIQNSNYRSIRRLVQDWPRLNKMQKQLVITRMLQYFRSKALRSELYSYIRDLARTQGLEAKNAHNAEGSPRSFGSDTLAKIATATAAVAGGYALGKSIGANATGMRGAEKLNQKLGSFSNRKR